MDASVMVAPFLQLLPLPSRLSCYKCITDTMQELVNQSKAAPQSPSVPKQPGPPVMTSDPNMLSNEEATAHVRHLMLVCCHRSVHVQHF